MTVVREEYQPLDRSDVAVSLGLAALTLALFQYFLKPPLLPDQLDYFYNAWQTDNLQPTHRHLRIGILFPVWLAIRIFGYSELSYYVVPAVGALFLALGTWFVGRTLFGTWAGGLAGLFVICNPRVLTGFTDLLPDHLAAGLYTASIGILLLCWQSGRLAARPTRLSTAFLLLLSGFLIGWSYLAREYVVFFFPIVICSVLLMRGRISHFAIIGLGAGICWLLELAWSWLKYGDPLARINAVAPPRAVSIFVEMDVIDVILQFPRFFWGRWGSLILFSLLIIGTLVSLYSSSRGDRRWQLLAMWLIGGWFFFTVIALIPVIWLGDDHVYLRMHIFRYWALILPPAVIAGVAGTQQLIAFIARKADAGGVRRAAALATGIATALVFVGATIGVVSASRYPGLVRNGMDEYAQFRTFMKNVSDADEVVLLQGGPLLESSGRSLPIYLNTWYGSNKIWQGRVVRALARDLDDIKKKPGRKLVAIDLSRTQKLRRAGRGRSPEEVLQRLEEAGDKVFESSGERVVVYKLEGKQEGG